MNVLSLFDGMSCGLVALERAGIKVDRYYASEIDKYAIKVSEKNYPNIIRLGDINNFPEIAGDWPYRGDVDVVIGGSPCQGFSFAGKQLAFDDPRSALFWKFVEIVIYYKPKYFLLENVRMKKEHLDVITKALGVEPICINSALVSAQNRVRYYWTNIPNVTQPEDKGILLKDILAIGKDSLVWVDRDKSGTILASAHKENVKSMLKRKKHNLLVWVDRDKSYCIDANYCKGASLEQYRTKCRRQLVNENNSWRKLTPLECERLQTLPTWYTQCEGVSNTQRYKMLGNGWTCDVLAHIFRGML